MYTVTSMFPIGITCLHLKLWMVDLDFTGINYNYLHFASKPKSFIGRDLGMPRLYLPNFPHQITKFRFGANFVKISFGFCHLSILVGT